MTDGVDAGEVVIDDGDVDYGWQDVEVFVMMWASATDGWQDESVCDDR